VRPASREGSAACRSQAGFLEARRGRGGLFHCSCLLYGRGRFFGRGRLFRRRGFSGGWLLYGRSLFAGAMGPGAPLQPPK